MNQPKHIDLLVGHTDHLAHTVTAYRCGHCNGEVTHLKTDNTTGLVHAAVEHDASCPVLTGTLSTLPDILRASTPTIPDTFRNTP